ncbi:biotin carboxyl carrier protein [Bacteroides luti]|uniref:Biotin carboxyl carrier protein n=1 Tax=Bacteroides luti TaxID=1297750 RepID=A0A1M5C5M4_9BACE|nr:acetyl-CoA carboxylase biotin carboxyl carrier protein subunit [Bacteroides luti]SHF50039.1 biotin carboxyl carrier protein [Bacteroides luti]
MEVRIGNRIAEIELIEKDGNIVRLTIDGIEYEVDVTMAENGACSILHDGKSYNAELIRSDNGKNYKVNTLFSSYNVDIVDTKAKYLRLRKKEDERQEDKIVSPMPGKIVKIPVKVGDFVAAGDTVAVIEAMKMQSNYKVTSDCYIKDILVNEGDSVNSDQQLILLDLNVVNA